MRRCGTAMSLPAGNVSEDRSHDGPQPRSRVRRQSTVSRRALNGALALSFGFGVSWIAFRASDYVTSDEERGALLGAPNFRDYCRAEHGERAEAMQTRTDARGWRCAFTTDGVFHLQEIDVNKVCDELFSGDTYASSWDMNNAYSWQCLRGPRP